MRLGAAHDREDGEVHLRFGRERCVGATKTLSMRLYAIHMPGVDAAFWPPLTDAGRPKAGRRSRREETDVGQQDFPGETGGEGETSGQEAGAEKYVRFAEAAEAFG